ncbi:anti-phage ZorAB system protein ZorA [Muricoccus radiodurans]|uniref:anti-phage ZorAB system protein ZorA n=1 Tax=Muricoccus radiodurans TaxID=2231721 RepID=UPI003CFA418B
MFSFSGFVSSSVTIGGVVAGLVAWAFLSGFFLRRGTVRVRAALAIAKEHLGAVPNGAAFTATYEQVADELERVRLLGDRWRDYRATLLLPRVQDVLVRATSRPDAWFDLAGLYRAAGTDLRYHAALPNLLVGAGLLFTFIGLAVALAAAGGIVSGDDAGAQRGALQRLLDTASFKFITSLAGLGLSIVYALTRKWLLRLAESDLDAFLAALESRIPFVTAAMLAEEANRLLERQGTQLESFSTELSLNISTALDSAFDQRLGEHVGPLREAMEKLAAGLSTRNEDAIARMLDVFVERLQGGAGERMNDVAASLSALGERLEGLRGSLGDAAVRMAESADAMATRMGEGAEAALSRVTDQMGGVAESLRLVAEGTRAAGVDAGAELARRVEEAAGGLEAAARGMGETLATAVAEMGRRMADDEADRSGRLRGELETMVAGLRELAEESRRGGTAALEAVAERIASAASAFEVTAARVGTALESAGAVSGGALGRGAEEAVSRIAEATEGMRTELGAMLAEMRGHLGQAGEAVRDGAREGGDALRGTLREAGDALAAALTGAAAGVRDAGEVAGTALRDGGGAAAERIGSAAGSLVSRAEVLAGAVRLLAEASDRLGARVGELDAAAHDAATPLAAAAADLKAAGAAARDAIGPLREVTGGLRGAIEGVGGAAGRLDAAAAALTRLSNDLAGVTTRFEGVDRTLAATVDAMVNGIQGFRRQVSEFVKETDENLAKAASALANRTDELEKTLGDFIEQLQRTQR